MQFELQKVTGKTPDKPTKSHIQWVSWIRRGRGRGGRMAGGGGWGRLHNTKNPTYPSAAFLTRCSMA